MISGSVSSDAFKRGFKLRDYNAVIDIPARKLGKYAIEHFELPANKPIEIASPRTRIFGGHVGGHVQYDHATRWHRLKGPTGTWMTDLPVEQVQHDEALKHVTRGSVLIGGLGLGYAATMLAQRKGIKQVTVIEISNPVVALVKDALLRKIGKHAHKVSVVNADLFKWLRAHGKRRNGAPFDHAFYDIWQSDGEETFHRTVLPLIALSGRVVASRPICWNEDIMRGQVFHALLSQMHMRALASQQDTPQSIRDAVNKPVEFIDDSDPAAPFVNCRVPFLKWWLAAKPDYEQGRRAAQFYAEQYGLPGWQVRWERESFAIKPAVKS